MATKEPKRVAAIVRGPSPHFGPNGVLYPPGAIVPANPGIPEDEVSDDNFTEKEVMVRLDQPVMNKNDELVTEVKRKVKLRVQFRPVGPGADVGADADDPAITDDPAKLNITDLLKKSVGEIGGAVTAGKFDAYLGAIEQGELAKKGGGRKGVIDAIAGRRSAIAA